ncbi:hypothetical protein P8452_59828 [Trifolium repens]|nr:hypothetical protein P8452_59828 [Trifolium repens]
MDSGSPENSSEQLDRKFPATTIVTPSVTKNHMSVVEVLVNIVLLRNEINNWAGIKLLNLGQFHDITWVKKEMELNSQFNSCLISVGPIHAPSIPNHNVKGIVRGFLATDLVDTTLSSTSFETWILLRLISFLECLGMGETTGSTINEYPLFLYNHHCKVWEHIMNREHYFVVLEGKTHSGLLFKFRLHFALSDTLDMCLANAPACELVTQLCEYTANVYTPIARESIWEVGKMTLQHYVYDVNIVVPLLRVHEMEKRYATSNALMLATTVKSSAMRKDLAQKYLGAAYVGV